MRMASRKLGEFFNIGRDRGWDVARQVWTVHSLVDPEGRVLTLGDVLDGIPLDLRLEKSGSRYGYPPLRQRIVESQRYQVAPEHLLVTSGTQHANFLAFAATLEAGDEAIVESPSWEQPQVLCEAFKVEPRILRRRPELGWRFDLDELRALLSPRVKLIYLCHPSNPTGAVLDERRAPGDLRRRGPLGRLRAVGRDLSRARVGRGALAVGGQHLRAGDHDQQRVEDARDERAPARVAGDPGPRPHRAVREPQVLHQPPPAEPARRGGGHGRAGADEVLGPREGDDGRRSRQLRRGGRVDGAERRVPLGAAPGRLPVVPAATTLDIPSWDLCVRLLDPPYRTYLIPGSCYGHEHHVRLGLGPGTPAETIRAGLARGRPLRRRLPGRPGGV